MKNNQISKVCTGILIINGLVIASAAYYSAFSIPLCILIGFIYAIIPVILSLILRLFKKSIFNASLWITTTLFMGFIMFYVIMYIKSQDDQTKSELAALRYFRNQSGLFSMYSWVMFEPEYCKIDKKSTKYIGARVLYRVGSKKRENYYIGRVQIDANHTITKEYYNIPIISDSVLSKSVYDVLDNYRPIINIIKDYR